MKLSAINQVEDYYARAIFSHETGDVSKQVRTHFNEDGKEANRFTFELKRAMVEAERDIAYKMFGDSWQNHTDAKSFAKEWLPHQLLMLEQAMSMRPDLFRHR